MTNMWNNFLWIPTAFTRLFSKGSAHMSEPINFSYFLHFFDVLLLQSLQKLAFSLTSIPAVLQASSLLPLDPPSHSSSVLPKHALNEAKPPFSHADTRTHIHVPDVLSARSCLISCQGSIADTCGFGAKCSSHLSKFYTFSLPLYLSLSPALLHSTSLWGHKHERAYGIKACGKWDNGTDHK